MLDGFGGGGVDVETGVLLTFIVLSGVTIWAGSGTSGSWSAPGGRIGFLFDFDDVDLGEEGGDVELSETPGDIPDEELLVRFGIEPKVELLEILE